MSENDFIELQIKGLSGKTCPIWSSYNFNNKFDEPTDAWSFTVGDDRIPTEWSNLLRPGTEVQLLVNGHPQCTGYIERKHLSKDRGKGTSITIQGRDKMGHVVNACMDPKIHFNDHMTLLDVLSVVFSKFGLTVFSTSDDVNRNIVTGKLSRNVRTVKTVSPGAKQEVLSANGDIEGFENGPDVTTITTVDNSSQQFTAYKLTDLKPHTGEGCFAFAARVCKRFGLWLWMSADGQQVIVGKPNFTQPTLYTLTNRAGQPNREIITASAEFDWSTQPSVIIACGYGGGGTYEKTRMKAAMVNELTGFASATTYKPEVRSLLSLYPDAVLVASRPELLANIDSYLIPASNPIVAPCFLQDDESKNIDQLTNFVKREMANRQQHALCLKYTVQGHTQNGAVWDTNSIVAVDDDTLGIHERMWISSRTFRRDAASGAVTDLDLIRLFTLDF